ncbi:MAG: DUF1109 domain-containing protein [Methylibium sp.]|nr:DUF1109 domain-containing protein [Methylibium sp.]MBA3623051.1 DUF1109 domain-containing protein [Methylibium sp.]
MNPQLLDRLASESSVSHLRAVSTRMRAWLAAAALAALALALLWLGPREDIASAVGTPMFWTKIAFPVALAALAWVTLRRSLRPGTRIDAPIKLMVGLLLTFWLIALVSTAGMTTAERDLAFWGTTWRGCPFYIALIALPMLPPAMRWSRLFAPLSPRLSGAVAGLACGLVAAAFYALHCSEPGLPFLGTWYLLGAAIPAAFGAWLGPASR